MTAHLLRAGRMPPRVTLAILGGGAALGLVASVQGLIHVRLAGRPASFDPLLANLPYWLLWAGLAPVIWRLQAGRTGRTGRTGGAGGAGKAGGADVTWHLAAAAVLMLCQSGALYGWQRLAGLTDLTVPLWQGALGIGYWRLVPNAVIYGLLMAFVWHAAPMPVAAGEPKVSAPLAKLVIKHQGRVTLLDVAEIDWIEAADYCVRVHAGGRVTVIRETMASLEARLDPARFCRIHRSAIVNLDRVREIRTAAKGEHRVLLGDGRQVPLNRSRRNRLEGLIALR